jgi:hypothetical protein
LIVEQQQKELENYRAVIEKLELEAEFDNPF